MFNPKRVLSVFSAFPRARQAESSENAAAREAAAVLREAAGAPPRAIPSSEPIPVVHRLAIVYLMLPVAVWLVGWFEWWFGLPCALLLALGLWPAFAPAGGNTGRRAIFSAVHSAMRPTTAVLLLIAMAWVMTTASGGVFDVGNTDWVIQRRALLALSQGDWPAEIVPKLRGYFEMPIVLRHYLGHYMVPGLLGRWLGTAALNWAVPLWTWCGVGLILLMFTRGLCGWKAVVAAAVLILFSGMDIVRIALVEGLDWFALSLQREGWPRIELGRTHLEWGGLRGADLQVSSHMVGLMWVPKHFIAAALYALLLLQLGRNERFLAVSGVLLAAALFWSPFVALGLLPFVLVLLLQNGVKPFVRWPNALLSLPLAALLYVYLTSGTAEIARGWVWEIELQTLHELALLPVIYLTEFLFLAILLFALQPQLRKSFFFVACIATLLILPLYSFGSFNDLVMRGAMPALFLLCYFCSASLTGQLGKARHLGSLRSHVLLGAILAVLAIGAVTPLFELARANNDHNFGVVRHESLLPVGPTLGFLEGLDSPDKVVLHYATNAHPNWFWRILRPGGIDREPAKGELVHQSDYAVYLDDRTLVFVKEACSMVDRGRRFFVNVIPLKLSDLPEGRTRFSYDFLMQPWNSFQIGSECITVLDLPGSYESGHIVIGQLNEQRTAHTWLAQYFSNAYRKRMVGEAGQPVVRSEFEVYIHQEEARNGASEANPRRLLYVKPECSEGDLETRMLLHVVPVSASGLAEDSKERGFNVLDFDFREFGGRSGDGCFAVRDLPEYAIEEIRLGWQRAGGVPVWAGRILLAE